jgi:hypothetical protein
MEVLQRTANRGSIATGAAYEIENSLKLESDNAEYIDNRHYTAGNTRTWTLSFWIKRTELGTTQKVYDAGNAAMVAFLSTDIIKIENSNLYLETNRVFRDTSAWYHIVVLNDSTQSTASDRAKLWINGVQETSFSIETYMAQNQEGNMNSATSISIGGAVGVHVNGYMAELFFVDGQALAPTDFGEFDDDSGIWKPKEYNGTLSGTSIKLDFSNSAALWEDSSGLTGNGTAMSGNNITSANQATDTPTNNFATLNPLFRFDLCTIFEGATRVKRTAELFDRWRTFASSIGVTSGKWYAEFQNPVHATAGNDTFIGVAPATIFNQSISTSSGYLGGSSAETTDSIGYHGFTGKKFINGTSSSFGNTYAGETVAVALDMDNGYVYFAKANAWQNSGDPTSGSSGTGGIALQLPNDAHYLACSIYQENSDFQANYGGYTTISISTPETDENGYGTFEYAPPSGYYALCTKNLAEYG